MHKNVLCSAYMPFWLLCILIVLNVYGALGFQAPDTPATERQVRLFVYTHPHLQPFRGYVTHYIELVQPINLLSVHSLRGARLYPELPEALLRVIGTLRAMPRPRQAHDVDFAYIGRQLQHLHDINKDFLRHAMHPTNIQRQSKESLLNYYSAYRVLTDQLARDFVMLQIQRNTAATITEFQRSIVTVHALVDCISGALYYFHNDR